MITLPRWQGNAARDARWLYEANRGVTVAALARREHLPRLHVQLGILRALEAQRTAASARLPEPILEPLFPLGPFTPELRPGRDCPHQGPLRRGSALCCMVCSQSGLDHHPALRRDPAKDPRPDRKPAAAAAPKRTRKERRQSTIPKNLTAGRQSA